MPLIVKPISANLTTDKDFWGKQDPYCKIWVGSEQQRTKTASGGGKNPQWSDTFQYNSQQPILKVQVWDDDTFSDDLIGEGTVNLNQCYQNPNRTENEYVDIMKNGRSAGRVLISIEWQGAPMGGGYGQQQQWGGQQQGGWGGQQQGGWGGQQQGGWGGQQQGGWGGQQGGWGNQPPQQGGWGGQQQGGWGGQGGHHHGGW